MVFNRCLERGFLLRWLQAAKFVPLSGETIFLLLAVLSQSVGMSLYKNTDQPAGPRWPAAMAAGLC